jgi:hypothetical protein
MSISSKIASSMSSDGDSFERVHSNLVKIVEDFAIDFADWKDENCFQATGTTLWYIPESDEFTRAYTNKQLLEIFKKQQDEKI